jgi:predicted TIM-barrel fold metal-dependent hydrolase
VNAPGRFGVLEQLAQRFEGLSVVIDHLGVFDVRMLDPAVRDTFSGIANVLPLAAYENISVKMTSVPLLSREGPPFRDAWPHLHAVIDAFGPGRVMWGTDAFIFDHPYDEDVRFVRDSPELSADEKALILGGTLRRVWGWPTGELSEASRNAPVGREQ